MNAPLNTPLDDILTFQLMALQEKHPDRGINTNILMIVINNLASLARASILVTDNLEDFSNYDVTGLVCGLVGTVEWVSKNVQLPDRSVPSES